MYLIRKKKNCSFYTLTASDRARNAESRWTLYARAARAHSTHWKTIKYSSKNKSSTWSKDCEKDIENHKRVERELLEQCGQVASKRLKELCRAKYPGLAIGHRQFTVARIAWFTDTKTQLEWRFVDSEYASGNERFLIWREPRLRIAFWSMRRSTRIISSSGDF